MPRACRCAAAHSLVCAPVMRCQWLLQVCAAGARAPSHTPPPARSFYQPLQEGKKADLPVYFGDAGSPAVLHAVGADKAACAVSHGAWRCRDLGADLLHDCAMSLCRAWRIPTAAGL